MIFNKYILYMSQYPYVITETENFLFFYKPPFYIMDTSTNYKKMSQKEINIRKKKKNKPFLLYIEEFLKNNFNTITDNESFNCCQRLDIETSGIVMVSKYNQYYPICRKIINNKEETIKLYTCLVNGLMFKKKGFIVINIECDKNPSYCRFYNKDLFKGKKSITYYEVLNEYKKDDKFYSLVNVRIFTGRTHQIRVSMNSQNTPIVSDNKYYLNKDIHKDNKKLVNRMFLHNYNLVVNINNNIKNVLCDLPIDLKNCLNELEIIKKYKYNNLYNKNIP